MTVSNAYRVSTGPPRTGQPKILQETPFSIAYTSVACDLKGGGEIDEE